MIQLILTEEQQRVINEAENAVEILDRSGLVLATVTHGFNAEEIAWAKERMKNYQPTGTFRQLIDRLSMSCEAKKLKPSQK